jgi:hypothetical protein
VKEGLLEWDDGYAVCGDENAIHLGSEGDLDVGVDVGGGGGVGAVVRAVGEIF